MAYRSLCLGECPDPTKGVLDQGNRRKLGKSQRSAIKRFISCYNCPQQCGALINIEGVPPYMIKCFSKLTYAMAAHVDDLDFSWRICHKAFEYGLDSFSTPRFWPSGSSFMRQGF